ncbi:type II toxin-antitoxin system HicA family toxin [Paenibacillus vulneris]|uniref:Type II toxin-antitoxin system HicA family toxin n=1 Tax=Paenibacillus vulneris TaxID=1133364 RepID=A0ABW3V0N8_9BACL
MAGVEKLIEKMRNRPNGIRFSEITKVLKHSGYREVRVEGSHHQYRNEKGDVITVKFRNPVKAVCVKDVLSRIGG